jgi:hypothetical protein
MFFYPVKVIVRLIYGGCMIIKIVTIIVLVVWLISLIVSLFPTKKTIEEIVEASKTYITRDYVKLKAPMMYEAIKDGWPTDNNSTTVRVLINEHLLSIGSEYYIPAFSEIGSTLLIAEREVDKI